MGNSCSVDITLEVNHIIWIDPEVDNDEITQYANELKSIKLLRVSLFKIVYEAISYLKGIKFRDAKVIVNGGLYTQVIHTNSLKQTKISKITIMFSIHLVE
jgi:hypothetical protein